MLEFVITELIFLSIEKSFTMSLLQVFKSSKKDSKITKLNNDVLDLNKYDDIKICNNDIVKDFSIDKKISSVMTNSSNQNQNKNIENENYIENEIKVSKELFCVGGSSSRDIATKKVLGPRRMSMRVKQNTNTKQFFGHFNFIFDIIFIFDIFILILIA